MQSLGALLITEYMQEIERKVEATRAARTMARSRRVPATWRRRAGVVMRRVGAGFEDLALRLDPKSTRPTYGRE